MGALSKLIRSQATQIAELWLVDARRSPAARGLTRAELTRGLHAQLHALAELADGAEAARATLEPLVEAQVDDRIRQGYELADVIHEYALLERCIYQTWASAVSHLEWPSAVEMARVHSALGEVLHAAIGLFTNYLLEEEQIEKRHVTMLYRIAGAQDATTLAERQRALLAEVQLAVTARALVAFRWDGESERLELESAVGLDEQAVANLLAVSTAPLDGSVLSADRTLELEPVKLHPALREALVAADDDALLAEPLRTGDRLLGLLCAALADRERLPARARRLTALAERLAPLWENARLYDRAQRDLTQLREERQLREWFVSTLAHDLRGPLSAAQINAELILQNADDPQIRRVGAKVVRGLHAADELIRDLLDVHRVRAGQKLPLRLQPCDLAEVAREVVDELSTAHAGRVGVELDPGLNGVFCATEVRRALWNLVSNALKYGDARQPVTIRLRRRPSGVEVTVHNYGPAITGDELTHIFEPYQRARLGESRSVGWGLGLALVKACAEAHGGGVGCRSSDTDGTTFEMFLPAPAVAQPQAAT